MHSVNHATAWYIKHIGRELAHTGDGRRSRRLLLTPLPSATGCATAAPRCQSGSRPSRRAEPANQCRATKRAPAGCSVSRTELVELLAQAVDQVPDVSPKCWMTTENDWSHLGNCWTSEWPWNAGVKRGTKSASSASEQLIGAPLLSSGAARTRDWFNPSIAHSYNRRSEYVLRREFRRVHTTSTTPLLITLVAGFTPLLITLVEGFAHQYVHIVPALAPLTFAPEGLKKNQTCSGWPEHD